ncbi:hypothetical protein [Suttonella ornithocola]|uniref:Uncharacterized protein n=1 Tax=Suttonella ornithocola TaxID=279832 RepID=A0A380MRN4_9GAMM|nr:hypothetical protein [Suttonella ornithocola]SUO94371.1 Uncharacterised protein [Suttonella ornithocola]
MNLPKIFPMQTIDNAKPHLKMVVEHILLLPELCPASRNPQSGSTLTLSYNAREKLLELFSLDKHIQSYIAHPIVRDMEYFTQTIAQSAANILQNAVTATAELQYNRLAQRQKIIVYATPEY